LYVKTTVEFGAGIGLVDTILHHQSETWAATIKWLISLHHKHDIVVLLGSALVASIYFLKDEQLSNASIKKWNSVWQEQGAEYADLSVD
jgi:hypothetical protein